MRPAIRYALALLTGLLAAAVAFVAARPVVEPARVWLVAALNALVWTGAVATYVPIYERFDGAPADVDGFPIAQLKWGMLASLVASVGIASPAVLLVEALPFRYVGATMLFGFGLVMLAMFVGMGTVAVRSDHAGHDRSGESDSDGPEEADRTGSTATAD